MALKIYLLGQFKLADGERTLSLSSRPAQSLLAYLAMTAGMTHRRERLAGLLWPESSEANARSYLRQALWRIRKTLDGGALSPEDYLQISNVSVAFNAYSGYWLDVSRVMESNEPASLEDLLEAADLYRGELLPGFYDEWIPPERDRILTAYQGKMRKLLKILLREERWQEAIKRSEQWIRLAHAPEQAYRVLMEAYAGLDDQRMVQATYERCQEALEQEMALKPSEETAQLYEALRSGKTTPQGKLSRPPAEHPARQPAFLATDEHPPPPEQTPFVGRERELEALDDLLHQALDGRGQVAFITGEAGGGKTSLLNEFARRAMAEHTDLILVSGSCNVHTGIGDPYLPFREILEMLTGDVEGRWAAGAISTNHAQRLWQSLRISAEAVVNQGPDLVNTFVHGPALSERVAASVTAENGWQVHLAEMAGKRMETAVSPTTKQSDYFEQYSRALQSTSRRLPLVLLIDDLQWADPGSISLLFHLGRQISGCRILILGAYRPEEITLGRDGERHPLQPLINEMGRLFGDNTRNLNEAQSRAFVDSILDSEPNQLGPSFRHLIYQQTRGNPLFTVELLRGMQERGDLALNESGQWVEEAALDWETLPARVEAVIAERIGRLDQPLRAALRVASVEGELFTAELLARVLGVEESEILALLNSDLERKHRLVKAQSIERKGDTFLSRYRFQHNLFQRYLYNNLSAIERAHLHEQVGTTLEALCQTEEDLADSAPQLARHFTEAQIDDKAIQYLYQAGKKAVDLSAYSEGIILLENSLQLLGSMPPSPEKDRQELAILLALGVAYQGTEGTQAPLTLETWTRAYNLSRQTGETLQSSITLGELSIHRYVRADYQGAASLAEQSLALAREIGDPLLIAMGHWYLGLALFGFAEFTRAQKNFAETTTFYNNPRQQHQRFVFLRGSDSGLSALAYEGCCLWLLGYWKQAQDRCLEALALAREFNHPFTLADVLTYAGGFYHKMKGDRSTHLACADELLKLLTVYEGGVWHGTILCFRGDALAKLGHIDEGIAVMKEGITINKSDHTSLNMTIYLSSLAEAYAEKGDLEESWAALNEAFAYAELNSEKQWLAEMFRIKANLLRMEGKDRAAQKNLTKALKVAREQNAKSWELRTVVDLARLYHEQGDDKAAHTLLEPIVDWFPDTADSPDLQEARTLLKNRDL